MIARRTRWQVAVFVLIAVVGLTYAGARYAGLGRYLGDTGYQVRLHLADSGGIFTNAEVSYRGVTVGRVQALDLTGSGVEAVLRIDSSAPPIPAASKAVVANRSAVGEQYVDLEPGEDKPPYLVDGSVIPQDRSTLPPGADQVLSNLDSLVRSVPADSLRTVVDELDKSFAGTGPDLQRLLDNARSLTDTANRHLAQAKQLLSSGRTVLDTQRQDSALITSFSSSLALIAQQLRKSDPDLRALISVTPAAALPVDDILRGSGQNLSVLLANLFTTTAITSSRRAGIEELLVAYPVITAFTPGLSPDGTGHLGLILNFFNPFPCTKGYESTRERPANDLNPLPANDKAYCAEPPNSPIAVRGSQNVPYGGMPQLSGGTPAAAQQQPLPGALGALQDPGPRDLAQLLGVK
ncbi:MCE family protein [Kutzneria albida]|uniref:MCE family protein n=1 Tax=Kutzneria albida TaxID=43357 RepID=UPI00046D7B47|nr:MlaD family protein [Kutzneria albida]